MCFAFGLPVKASEGNIDIIVSEEEEFSFSYTKVADYVNGKFILINEFQDANVDLNHMENSVDIRRAAKELIQYSEDTVFVTTEHQVAHIDNLSQGVYLIQGMEKEGYDISATLISIPGWDGTQEEMSYQITVLPKIQRSISSVETGDDNQLILSATLCLLSIAAVTGVAYSAYFLKDK